MLSPGQQAKFIVYGTRICDVKYATYTGAGGNIVSAVSGKRIAVLGLVASPSAGATVEVASSASSMQAIGADAANPLILPPTGVPYFIGLTSTAVSITPSSGTVRATMIYAEVD